MAVSLNRVTFPERMNRLVLAGLPPILAQTHQTVCMLRKVGLLVTEVSVGVRKRNEVCFTCDSVYSQKTWTTN